MDRAAGVLQQLPAALRLFAEVERFRLHNVTAHQVRSRDPDFDERYLPQNCQPFRLTCFRVPERTLYIYGEVEKIGRGANFIRDALQEQGMVLFPVHPSCVERYARVFGTQPEPTNIWALPTSSTRTLLVWPDENPNQALFVKTTLHTPMFGDRRLTVAKVAGSIGLSSLAMNAWAPASLRYLPEPFGCVPRKMRDGGFIVRNIPADLSGGAIRLIPLFALYGGSAADRPLILDIADCCGLGLEGFIDKILCQGFARLWLEMTFNEGLMLEAHGQDLMLALSPDLSSMQCFYYRDFEGLQVDWELRRALGLPTPELPNSSNWFETYGTWGGGFPGSLWFRMRISLFDYVYFVLRQLESEIPAWRRRGLLRGGRFREGALTLSFSRHIERTVESLFDVRLRIAYDACVHINRLIIDLMRLRRELLARAGGTR